MTADPYRMRRSGRPRPGRRAAAVVLLILLAAVGLFPVDGHHHDTAAHTLRDHVTASADASHHHTGDPAPPHGHRHESGLVTNMPSRARLTVPGVTVAVAVAPITIFPISPEAAPGRASHNVDLHLLGVLRV